LTAQARAFEHFYEGLSGAIEDRQLEGINLDENIVHAARVKRCKDMLGGRKQHALLHQAGRVADARDVANVSLKGESVQVCAAKYDAGAGRRWGELQARTYRGVESDAFSFYSASNGVLECHRKD
jgi:cytidylate kinase